jgi:hypothetical protein
MKNITLITLVSIAVLYSCSKSEKSLNSGGSSNSGGYKVVEIATCQGGGVFIVSPPVLLKAEFEDAAGNTVNFQPKPNKWYSEPSSSIVRFNFGPNPTRIDATETERLSIKEYDNPCK